MIKPTPMSREERDAYRLKRAAIIAEQSPPTVAEETRVARAGALYRHAQTVTQWYKADRASVPNKPERKKIWRIYAMFLLQEQKRRIEIRQGIFWEREMASLGGSIAWKKANGDKQMKMDFIIGPHWRHISDEDLLVLEDALIRARFKG